MTTQIEISVAILAHNAAARIRSCIDSVLQQTRLPNELIVIDNASTDETIRVVEDNYSDVRIEHFETNNGCSGGRNRQIANSRCQYVMIVDDDATLDPNCLEQLEKAVIDHPDASIWSPRVCYESNKNLIQYDGGELHYTGETIAVNAERPLQPHADDQRYPTASNQVALPSSKSAAPLPEEPFAISVQGGVAYLIDREAAAALGGYDETYFFGRSDGELSFRLTLSGRTILAVPKAIVYHQMKKRGMKYVRNQIRNRWILLLTTYSWRTFLVIAPALLVYECSLIVFLSVRGHLFDYFAANMDVLKSLPQIMEKRRKVQSYKERRDRETLSADFMNMRADVAGSRLVRALFYMVNRFFGLYWLLVRKLVA